MRSLCVCYGCVSMYVCCGCVSVYVCYGCVSVYTSTFIPTCVYTAVYMCLYNTYIMNAPSPLPYFAGRAERGAGVTLVRQACPHCTRQIREAAQVHDYLFCIFKATPYSCPHCNKMNNIISHHLCLVQYTIISMFHNFYCYSSQNPSVHVSLGYVVQHARAVLDAGHPSGHAGGHGRCCMRGGNGRRIPPTHPLLTTLIVKVL